MSLSSALFTGTSGLTNMGNSMQVIGNNISNVNTVGFKKGNSTFADTLYENVATRGGADQMGRGMAVGDVGQNFGQGSFESTGKTTDLSIGGDGFFVLRQNQTENRFYSRAGNFYFDKNGQLINPEGYIVQGWELESDTGEDVGSIGDVILETFTSPPEKSSKVTAITNLDADAASKSVVLSNNWDSSEDTYMEGTNYEYQTTVKAYDSLGSTHDITIYYDKISDTNWEYVVTCNPSEDERNLVQETTSKGLLARGEIEFSQSSGDILNLSMERFTGRVGNVQANGVNTEEAIAFQAINYDKMALDGYGFSFEFDGSTWNFQDLNGDGVINANDKPENYGNTEIVYSDNQEIHLAFDPSDSTDPDLKIKMDQPAVATDSFSFDINNKNDMHIQGLEGTRYFGDTANDNTTLQINDPGVMTHDSEDLGIIWNPTTEEWHWSNPTVAYNSTSMALVTGIESRAVGGGSGSISPTSANVNITNAEDLGMYVQDVTMMYDGAAWDWFMPLKEEDFTSTYDGAFSPINEPVLSVTNDSTDPVRAIESTTNVELHWLATSSAWSISSGSMVTSGGVGNMVVDINTAASSDTTVEIDLWNTSGSAATASTVTYSFGSAISSAAGQSIAFSIDPTPPAEYLSSTAEMLTTVGGDPVIDFTPVASPTDSSFELNLTSGANAGDVISLDINPDVPPAEYPNATLKGDETEAVIDLDGSGNETDNDDIVFSFEDPLSYGANTDPYDDRSEISFDISGSTSWTELDKSDITKTGYFSFLADFLGGEFGTTEQELDFDIGTIYDGENFTNDSMSTTQYSKASSTTFQDADGYSAGDLTEVDVASDGVMTGVYSNGEIIPLFRIGLAKFLNNNGLSNEGGNLFRETRESGTAITNKPGENGLGTISPNSLEMSNVDLSEEFVDMITTQRGFQANSKTITTTDEMMQTVINMKR